MAMVKSFLSFPLAFVLAGCCGGAQSIQQYDLEERCGSLPCGVSLVNGSASITTTFHAGEHGLRLEKNTSIRIDQDPTKPAPLEQEAQLQVLFLCDEGTNFEVVLGSEDASGPAEVSLTGTPSPPTDTDEFPVATFVIPVPGHEVFIRPQLRFLQFTTIGPGGCILDNMWVFVPNLCAG
jgi:hypothetical protein